LSKIFSDLFSIRLSSILVGVFLLSSGFSSFQNTVKEASATPGTCSDGTTFNQSDQKCEATPTCPAGMSIDHATGECTVSATSQLSCPSGTTFTGIECTGNPTCPSGTFFNGDFFSGGLFHFAYCSVSGSCPSPAINIHGECFVQVCVHSLCLPLDVGPATTCPSGTTFNGQFCKSFPTCPSGTFNQIGQCQVNPTVNLSCPSDTTLNGQICIANPTCPIDSFFDVFTDLCIGTLSSQSIPEFPFSFSLVIIFVAVTAVYLGIRQKMMPNFRRF